ncbi:hypothetical protein [Lutispora sp.]|uniref:hypothetical protein n=1 Tax=Lutispora sp. TaxID=2828727 RepID=UPI0035615F45
MHFLIEILAQELYNCNSSCSEGTGKTKIGNIDTNPIVAATTVPLASTEMGKVIKDNPIIGLGIGIAAVMAVAQEINEGINSYITDKVKDVFFANDATSSDEKSTAKLPNQGTVNGNVEGAPPVDAGKQGKHVQGHPNNVSSKSQWKSGETGVNETQEAWQNGTTLKDGTKVWDAGKVVGQNGETGVRVHTDGKGNIHGYPVNPGQYLK